MQSRSAAGLGMNTPRHGVALRRVFVGTLLSIVACSGIACDHTATEPDPSTDGTVSNTAANTALAKPGSDLSTPRGTAKYALSAKAREIEKLLDRGATSGAERLLSIYLNSDPGDAGLLAQYARFVILTHPASGVSWIASPLDTSDNFRPLYIVAKASMTASDLDPDIRPYLAELLLSSFEGASRTTLDRGEGVISDPVLFMTPFEASLANVGWVAIECDAERAERWSKPFEALAAQAARNGKVASAMMLGNLAGDLMQRGEGDQDFRLANKYFLESMKNVGTAPDQAKLNWIRVTLNAYSTLFADELAAVTRGQPSDSTYDEVLAMAKQLGAR